MTDRIAPGARPTPHQIRSRIASAFASSAATDATRIEVELQDGNVVLKGSVRSWLDRLEATRAAWAGPGVYSVRNDLVVEAE